MAKCDNFTMGTHRKIPNVINKGKVSTFYSPNTEAKIYTPYDQGTDYFYIKYKGPPIKNSSIEMIGTSNELDVVYRFLKEKDGFYSLEVVYVCQSLFKKSLDVILKISVPECGPYEVKWKKICRLAFLPKFTLQIELFNKGQAVPFIKQGKYVFHLPGKTTIQSNNPAEGYVVEGNSVSLRISSFLNLDIKKRIDESSKNKAEAKKTENALKNFKIVYPKILYDKEQLHIEQTGNLLLNQSIENFPKFLNLEMKCLGKLDNLIEVVIQIDKFSAYSIFLRKKCSVNGDVPKKPPIIPKINVKKLEGPQILPIIKQKNDVKMITKTRKKTLLGVLIDEILEVVLYCTAFIFFLGVLFLALLVYQSKSPKFSNHLMKIAKNPDNKHVQISLANSRNYGTIID